MSSFFDELRYSAAELPSPLVLAVKVVGGALVVAAGVVGAAYLVEGDDSSGQRLVTDSIPPAEAAPVDEDEAMGEPQLAEDAAGPRVLDLSASSGFLPLPVEEVDVEGAEAIEDSTSSTDPVESSTTSSTPAPSTDEAPELPAMPAPPPLGSAPGTDLRVLHVDASNGSGGNPGTEEKPFRRPVDALSIAEPGTTIYLRAGTYDTDLHSGFSIRRSGTPENWIRIAPYPGERVELVSGGEYGNGFEISDAAYVEITGFVIRGRDDSIHGSGVFVNDGSHDVRVVGNAISNFGGAGVSVIGSSRVTIEGNDIRNNATRSSYQGSGITLFRMSGPTNSGHTNIVRGNYLVGNRNEVVHHEAGRITDGNCIIMDRNNETNYTGWTLIENNVCAENGGRGIHSYRSSYIEARNNTLYHNLATDSIVHGRGEMTVGEGRDVYFYNNLVINRPGIAAYTDVRNTNTRFVNNYVMSGPPPGEGNQVLPSGLTIFSSTTRGGAVEQFRPLASADLAGTADSSKQASIDFSGRARPGIATVGAFEP